MDLNLYAAPRDFNEALAKGTHVIVIDGIVSVEHFPRTMSGD